MGWLFTQGQTKPDLIRHLTEADPVVRTHRKCVRGSTLWAIQENTAHLERGRFIVAYLLRCDRGYGWGYKPVTESMGPAEVSCPVGYLDQVPVPDSPYARDWRAEVRQHHAEQNRRRRMMKDASVGDPVQLVQGVQPRMLVLVSTKPLVGKASDGSRWRVPPRLIETIGSNRASA